MAHGGAWHKKKVIVRDYLPESRKADLEEVVVAFNEIMPKRGPRLVYVAMPEAPCNDVRAKGGISVCEDPTTGRNSEAIYSQREHVISAAKIVLSSVPPGPLCHELMHALTDVPDVAPEDRRTDSCVHFWQEKPGAYDVQYLRWAYKKYGRDRRHR
jgi:hypothetical protein